MKPIDLMALAAEAGFVFNGVVYGNNDTSNDPTDGLELSYSKDQAMPIREDKPSAELNNIDVLPEYLLIKKLVEEKFPLIFVTGGAGTGKSTFIKWLLKQFKGTALLSAPTAMAAINIEGKTLHSLCQLPPAWIVKKDIKHAPHRNDIKEAKLLIIDEISMVTANLLDGVSAFLRQNREGNSAFGGMTVIMVGDLFQLPPVVSEASKPLFDQIYGSSKFFKARCLRNTAYYAIELKKTFRQSNQDFVNILTKIRERVDIEESLRKLNEGCTITDTPPIDAVWLSPRNVEVESRNIRELDKLDATIKSYQGKLTGQFKADRLPSPMDLVLKLGAQVMFTKNDMNRRWINGSVGTVVKMGEDKITVKMSDSLKKVEVERDEWLEYQYRWGMIDEELERFETGSFIQFPLVLAWAMTIHKSQGRTLEKVHLNLGQGAFETGQTYVALSRCRSLEGLSLARPLIAADILVDQESKEFYQHLRAIINKLPADVMMDKISNP
jgi:ATP-dependent DNA helicase PIF1